MGTFPDDVVRRAWQRSSGQCECARAHSWHMWKRCPQRLVWNDRGKEKDTGWEAHHIVSEEKGGPDTYSNCEIRCQKCHKATQTFG